MVRRSLVVCVTFAALTGCSGDPAGAPDSTSDPSPGAAASTTADSTDDPTSGPTATATAGPPPAPAPRRFDADRAMRTVRHLALRVGPRPATGPAFRRAAAYVERRLTAHGYVVRRQPVAVPAGDSWGVPVAAGRSRNVVAEPPGFDPAEPWLLVGAHLDTVAVAPGAEDNASGVAVLLEVARVLGGGGPTGSQARSQAPSQVVLVAFGAEEPVGPGDLHHFGSRAYVAALGPAGRTLRGMVSLDRVGVGSVVPLSSVEGTPSALRDRLARLAGRERIPTVVETDSASDHESFADAGHLAARIGSTPYAGYHSAQDLPAMVDPAQLRQVGRLVMAWLRAS